MNLADNIWQILLALGGTVCLVVLLGYVAKRVQGSKLGHGSQISVLETTHVGTKERLVLLDVCGEQVLVGVTAQQITHLARFDKGSRPTSFGDALSIAEAAHD